MKYTPNIVRLKHWDCNLNKTWGIEHRCCDNWFMWNKYYSFEYMSQALSDLSLNEKDNFRPVKIEYIENPKPYKTEIIDMKKTQRRRKLKRIFNI